MRKLTNIRLKNVNNARSVAIFAIKAAFGFNLAEAKKMIDEMLNAGEKEATYIGYEWGSHVYEYDGCTPEHFESIMSKAFDYDLERVDRPSNENMREPCEATKKALAWLDSLGEEEKEMVKLIGDWEHPISWAAPVC